MKKPIKLTSDDLIGLTYDQAVKKARKHNYTLRVTRCDGKPHLVTGDIKEFRIDIHLENGKVVS